MSDRDVPDPEDSETWQSVLSRRMKTLARLGPLHRIEADKGSRDRDLAGIDLRALCLRALDLTIESMGPGTGGISQSDLGDALLPLIAQMRPDLAQVDLREIADLAVCALLNERERRREFSEPYMAFDGPRVVLREANLRLLRARERSDGSIVLEATKEAINIYAGMLNYDVEDAQIAAEAILRAQLQRGHIDRAVQAASQARLRSIEFEQKLQARLETVRRDVKQVDWEHEMLAFLADARVHVEERQHDEREILRTIDERLEAAGSADAPRLVQLRDIVDGCFRRHVELHRRLISANAEYLREQDRQVFRPRLAASLPDLEAEILRPALALPAGLLAELSDALLGWFQPPRPIPLLRLSSLVDRLLAPRRDDEPVLAPEDPELERVDAEPRFFTAEDEATVTALLADVAGDPRRLSSWLADLRADGVEARTLRLLVLRLLGDYGRDKDAAVERWTARATGDRFIDRDFIGDDLVIQAVAAEEL